MYSQFKRCVRTSDGTSEYFSQENRVLQGKSLAPILFALHINERKSKVNDIDGRNGCEHKWSDVC